MSNILCIFGHFWRFQQKNWCHILKSVLKVDQIMWLRIIYFLFKIKAAWASPKPWTKLIFRQQAHLRPFLKVPEEEKKLTPHSQISFKSWQYNADSELIFFFQNKCYGGLTLVGLEGGQICPPYGFSAVIFFEKFSFARPTLTIIILM